MKAFWGKALMGHGVKWFDWNGVCITKSPALRFA